MCRLLLRGPHPRRPHRHPTLARADGVQAARVLAGTGEARRDLDAVEHAGTIKKASSAQLARQHGFARAMRREPTASERVLWAKLSASKLGVGFRRQVVVDGCIVDFLAPSRRLIVEVDGAYHRAAAQRRSDARRDRRLQRAGYRVLRLPAELVLTNAEEAAHLVRAALA